MTLQRLLADAANHVLRQHAWAVKRLRAHGGRRLRFELPPWSGDFCISPLGFLVESPQTSEAAYPDLTVTLPLAALGQLLRGHPEARSQARLSGQAELAETVGLLMRELRWNAEDDLASWVGDVPAFRITQWASTLGTHTRELTARVHSAVTEYFQHEAPNVVSRSASRQREANLAELLAHIAALERRISRL